MYWRRHLKSEQRERDYTLENNQNKWMWVGENRSEKLDKIQHQQHLMFIEYKESWKKEK